MTRLPTSALLLLVLPGLGCASRAKLRTQEEEIQRLKTQLASVQREQALAREQNESIKNELFVLHDRVDTARTMLARTQQAPPKLEVVKLTPAASKDPLAARVKPVRLTPVPDPTDDEGYDPSADEAEMFSFADDDAIPLSQPKAPATRVASVHPTPAADADPVPEALAGTKTTGPKEDPMKMYQRAFGLFQAKSWGDAMLAFETFVRAYPSHEYTDNAYYWMGECFYAQGEYALAIEEFQKIPELYPGGNKVPDALLKIGLAYQSLNNAKSAAKTFRQLVDAYPQSEAAELGRQRLAKLPQ